MERQVLIIVEGGSVMEVYAHPSVDVLLLDRDNGDTKAQYNPTIDLRELDKSLLPDD